jgi:hypothetical protein
MFQKGSRVRHINEQLNKQYGVMEIWEIKNGFAICRYGDYYNLATVNIPLSDLKIANE